MPEQHGFKAQVHALHFLCRPYNAVLFRKSQLFLSKVVVPRLNSTPPNKSDTAKRIVCLSEVVGGGKSLETRYDLCCTVG